MFGCYDLYFGETVIGQVNVVRQGLYGQISCSCVLPDRRMYRLCAKTDTQILDIGILYSKNKNYGLDTCLPLKRLGQGGIIFFVKKKDENEDSVWLEEGKPFAYLRELENCRFVIQDGKPALKMFCEKNG